MAERKSTGFTFTVRPDGAEPFEIEGTTRDILAWERTTKGASIGQLENNPRVTDLYKIAHLAAKRRQMFTGDLAEFMETCDLDVHDEDDDEDEGDESGLDPTREGR